MMDEDVKNLVEWLEDKHGDVANLWGMENVVGSPSKEDKPTLDKIFTEPQLRIIVQLVRNVVSALKFHSEDDDSAHPDIREKLGNVDAKLRNHRHNLDQTYSSKAEF